MSVDGTIYGYDGSGEPVYDTGSAPAMDTGALTNGLGQDQPDLGGPGSIDTSADWWNFAGALSGGTNADNQNTLAAQQNLAAAQMPSNASNAETISGQQQTAASQGALSKVMQGLGIAKKDGSIDYSDKATMDKILRSIAVGGTILNSLMGGNKPKGYQSAQDLKASLSSPFNSWTPQQSAQAQSYFGAPMAASRGLRPASSMPNPIVPGRQFAEGGEVEGAGAQEFHSPSAVRRVVSGPGGGQDDLVPARLGAGEYVLDADIVSALGDGDTNRGAKILDEWREKVRAHKRSAAPTSIPPKAKAPEVYLSKVKGVK